MIDLFTHSEKLLWMERIACVDLNLDDFFVEAGRVIAPETQAVCRACPVRKECLSWAYERGWKAGYFGGLSHGQRDKMTLDEALDFIVKDSQTHRSSETR